MKSYIIFITSILLTLTGVSQDIYITTQSDLNSYQGTPKFVVPVRITTTPGQDSSTMITDLSPLLSCDSFLFDLRIYNTALTSLDGLQNTKFIYNLYIYDNKNLVDATSLAGPKEAASIDFDNNTALKKLPDFSFIEYVPYIKISNNAKLDTVNLSLMNANFDPSINYSRTTISVFKNKHLEVVLLNDPNEVIRGFGIDSNQTLSKIHLYRSNDSLNMVNINGNPLLNHISGFQDVKNYGFVSIKGNPNLTELCFLQQAINDSSLGMLQVDANGQGANSEAEIMATDCSNFNTGIKELAYPNLKLYPNPAHNEVFVEMPTQLTTYQIYDMSGKIVQQGTVASNGRIGLASVSGGMYVLLVNNKRSKLVIQ